MNDRHDVGELLPNSSAGNMRESRLTCPVCSNVVTYSSQQRGQTIKCGECGESLKAPEPEVVFQESPKPIATKLAPSPGKPLRRVERTWLAQAVGSLFAVLGAICGLGGCLALVGETRAGESPFIAVCGWLAAVFGVVIYWGARLVETTSGNREG